MPLHLICECCKRKKYITKDIWLISKNHSLSNTEYLCTHLDYNLDHDNQIGFWGICWSNRIKKNNWL